MTGRWAAKKAGSTIGVIVLGTLIAAGQLGPAMAAPRHASPASGTRGSHAPTTPVRHFVVLLQENHTFDNYFGTYPGADGIPHGVCMPVNLANGPRPCVRPFHIGNRAIVDLDHSELSARHDLSGGRMNGFVAAQRLRSIDAKQAMGYYNGSDLRKIGRASCRERVSYHV